MKDKPGISMNVPSLFAILLLATAVAVPARAQQNQSAQSQLQAAQDTQQDTQASATSEPPAPYSAAPEKPGREGFWGRVNPFARKKWVKNRIDPITGQLTELDEVNAKNSRDIKDVDARSQAGIRRAQSTADTANQMAAVAGTQASQAHFAAQNALHHVDALNTTINSLDTYNQKAEVVVAFRGGQPILSSDARKSLDTLAAQLSGQPGYILEVEAHSPARGAVGIQNSERLAEAVKRYLVTEHSIPVYRLHAVALGNAHGTGDSESDRPVLTSSVHIRLMENSLAVQGSASPQSATP